MDGLAHLRREAPTHALMLAVMAGAMVSGSALASMAGAGLLLIVSVVCAALSRVHSFLREHVVDLWAMALALIVSVPHGVVGHHAMAVDSAVAFGAVTALWALARVWLGVRGRADWRVAASSGALTGASLVVMALLCL